MTTKITKKFALDFIEKTVKDFLGVKESDAEAAGRLTTQMFDMGARAGIPQKNIEVFIMTAIKREQFRSTGTI